MNNEINSDKNPMTGKSLYDSEIEVKEDAQETVPENCEEGSCCGGGCHVKFRKYQNIQIEKDDYTYFLSVESEKVQLEINGYENKFIWGSDSIEMEPPKEHEKMISLLIEEAKKDGLINKQ